MKILVTGNPEYGIAKSLNEVLTIDHTLVFLSRKTNDTDLTTDAGIDKLLHCSTDCDIFINNSCLINFSQTTVYYKLWNYWKSIKKSGLIINIGSNAEKIINQSWIYSAEKSALKKASEQGSYKSTWEQSGIKVTYISIGHVNTPFIEKRDPKFKKHTMNEIANLVKWVIEYPVNTNIHDLTICPIQ